MKRNKKTLYCVMIVAFVLLAAAMTIYLWDLSASVSSEAADRRAFPVYISEVLASNTLYPNEDGICCDYIELYNSAEYPVSLSRYQLTDGGKSKRYVFPSGTEIGAGEYLVVYCSSSVSGDRYAPFGVSRSGGETLYLLTKKSVVVDSVVTVETTDNQAMVFSYDGVMSLSSFPTPGMAPGTGEGSRGSQQPHSPVYLSEIMASNSLYPDADGSYHDWIELGNRSDRQLDISGFSITDKTDLTGYVFPAGTVIPPHGFFVLYCDPDAGAGFAPFAVSKLGGETLSLLDEDGRILDMVETMEMGVNFSMVREPSNDQWSLTQICTPGFENSMAGYQGYQVSIGIGLQSVKITEIMAANKATLPDREGSFHDWIELYNTLDTTVDLTGWHLSDDPDKPEKWTFPSLSIGPKEYLIVFCSGQDRAEPENLHTSFSLSAKGETLVLTTHLDVTADTVTFGASEEDSSWSRDLGSNVLTASRLVSPGFENGEKGYEAFCSSQKMPCPLAIWEVMTSNDSYLPQGAGKCYDWVEFVNPTEKPLHLSDFTLTDDSDEPERFRFPDKELAAGARYVLILSGDTSLSTNQYDHASFSLNAMEERLYLYCNGELIDYVLLQHIPNQYSYGRIATGSGFFYMKPSPGAENNEGWRTVSQLPHGSVEPGVWVQETPVALSFTSPGTVYYTLDGSDPSASSLLYEGPIQVSKTTLVRAVAVEEGKMISRTYTSLFVINEPHSIPVVSLVTDPADLKRIYRSNYNVKDIEVPANLSYTGEDGTFSLDCGISMHGMTSLLAQPKKSFTVRFRNNYDGPLKYDVFGDGIINEFYSLVLRADQESTYSSYMRDNLFGYIATYYSDGVMGMNYKYVALYLNGSYWGIYALREHHSPEYYATHMHVPVDTVHMDKNYIGYGHSLREVYLMCYDERLSDEDYAYICSVLDMESFADWLILEAYTGNFDINGNMRYYYSSWDGLWRCGLVDVDLGMFQHYGFKDVLTSHHHGTIPTALIKRPEFQEIVIRRLQYWLSGPLSDERMVALIDEMAAQIREEIPLEKARWGGTARQWEGMVDWLRGFCTGRAKEMVMSLSETLHLTSSQREEYFGGLY